MSLSLIIHHGGMFEGGENRVYKGGDVAVAIINDTDRWSYFEAVGLVKDLGYNEDFDLWWMCDSPEYDGGLKSLKVDLDASNLAEFAALHSCDIHLYVESLVGETIDGVEKEGEGNVEIESEHEDEAAGVHFYDSEEERATALDDGFQQDVNLQENVTTNEEKGRKKVWSTHVPISPAKRAAMGINFDSTSDEESIDGDYEMEEEYESEELHSSSAESDEDETVVKKIRYPVFKRAEFDKNYQFRVGLEFKSTVEFKEVMLEYAVLNGRQLKYKCNEPNRVRLVCKKDCGYVAYCSRVGQAHTYRLKTYKPKHKCGRVFNNKNANSKWVSKHVADKLMSSNKVKIAEIITDIRKNYATGITVCRAWKGIKNGKRFG